MLIGMHKELCCRLNQVNTLATLHLMLTMFTITAFGTDITMVPNPQIVTRFLGPEMNHSSIHEQVLNNKPSALLTYIRFSLEW